MIIRKPYAFLIKYFKIIHIILFVFMTYLLFKIRALYIFFRDFLKTGTYTYVTDIVSKYINIPMIIMTIILIALLLLIFFLMRQKKKPIFYYITATIYYFITFVSFIFFIGVFNNLDYQTYSNQTLALFRDLTLALYYLNFFFIIIAFVRGFGFNVKKFNFEKDIKELDITEADREEIEVGVAFDVDNVSNFLRRKKRNFGYYLKENSFILIVFLVIVVLGVTAYISIDRLVFNKVYHEGDLIVLNNIDYTINSSFLTNKDKYGNLIKNKNIYYLIVDFTTNNHNKETKKIEIQNTRIKVGEEYYYPKNNVTSKFLDLGTFYKNQNLGSNVESNYIIAFEITDSNIKDKIILELFDYKKDIEGEAEMHYKEITLNPYKYETKKIGNFKLMENASLKDTYLGKGVFSLNGYEVFDIVNYTYTKCYNKQTDGKCTEYQASVVPSSGKKILKVSYTGDTKANLFSYVKLEYQKDGVNKIAKNSLIKNLTPSNYNEDGVALLEVPEEIEKDMKLKFVFDLWGATFTYE